jgi:hypothetical protein
MGNMLCLFGPVFHFLQSAHLLESVLCQRASRLLDVELAQLVEHILLHTRARRGHPSRPAATCTKNKKNEGKTNRKNKAEKQKKYKAKKKLNSKPENH